MRRRLAGRTLSAIRLLLVAVVASSFLGAGPARSQEAPPVTTAIGSFSGTAGASAVQVTYNPAGLLPTGAVLDLGAPDALATIASGPSSFARASAADPGDLIANPDALLAQATSAWESGTLPPYPYRISATHGIGQPKATSNPAPGVNASVEVAANGSVARSAMPGLSTPGVISAGSLVSTAQTTIDGDTVTVHARSEVGQIDIAGLIKINGVITDVTATSVGGAAPELKGGTTVTGATLLGTPIAIDDQGIRGSLAGIDLGSLLADLGVSITLPGRVALPGSTAGQLASTGLRIDIKATAATVPGLEDLLDLLPPIEPIIPGLPGVEDVLAVARANHLTTVEFGRAVVALTASPEVPFPELPVDSGPPTISTTDTGIIPSSGGPVAQPNLPPTAPSGPVATPDPVDLVTEPTGLSLSTGIGAVAALVLLLQPWLGDRLARIAALQLGTATEACPWERS